MVGGSRLRRRLHSHLFNGTQLVFEELVVAVFFRVGSRFGGWMKQDDENCVLGWLGFRSSPNFSWLSCNMTLGSRGFPRVAWYLLLLMALPSRPQVLLTHVRERSLVVSALMFRGAGSTSGGLRSVGDWWGWSLTTLLDGLHGAGAPTTGPPGTQVGFRPRSAGGPGGSVPWWGLDAGMLDRQRHMCVLSF